MSNRIGKGCNIISVLGLLSLQLASVDPVCCANIAPLSARYAHGAVAIQDGSRFMYDYFDAGKDAHIKNKLGLVEAYHLNKKVHDNIRAGRYQSALGDIDYTLRHFPNHPMGLQLVATVGVLSKNKALPIRYFEKAVALYPGHSLTHAQYGWYLVTIGDLDEGIRKVNYAVQLEPKLVAGYVWLAQAYQKKGDVRLAEEARERAKELGYKGGFPGSDPGH